MEADPVFCLERICFRRIFHNVQMNMRMYIMTDVMLIIILTVNLRIVSHRNF